MSIEDLPYSIITSKILTTHHLNLLTSVKEIPAIDPSFEDDFIKNIVQYYSINPDEMEVELHRYAVKLLDRNETDDAWQVLLTLC